MPRSNLRGVMQQPMRELIFMGDSLDALREFPDEVKQDIGYALHFAQEWEDPS
jgi:phage-related protein